MKRKIWKLSILSLVLANAAQAGTFTWNGSTDGNWNTGTNWTGGVPASATDTALVFDSGTTLTTTNNIPGGLVLNSLTLGPGSGVRTLNGNALIFDGDAPTLSFGNTTGIGNTELHAPVVLNQTLRITGGTSFDTQGVTNSTAVFSGTGGLRLLDGILALNAATSSFSGEVVVEGGLFGVGNATALGNTPSVTVQAGGAVQLTGGLGFTVDKPLSLAGAGGLTGAEYALAAAGGGAKGWRGAITLADDATVNAFGGTSLSLTGIPALALDGHTLTFDTGVAADDVIFVLKPITGAGSLVINADANSGGVQLSPTNFNSFTGSILVNSGALRIKDNSALGDTANVITIDGGILRADGVLNATTVTLPSTRSIVIGEGGATFSGRTPNTSQTLVIDSVLSGANPIRIEHNVRFNGDNTFDGTLTIAPAGTLTVATETALGAADTSIRLAGDTNATATLSLLGSATLSADRVIEITGARGRIQSSNNINIASTLIGPGELELGGNRVKTLSGVNTHGGTRLVSGELRIANDAALGAPGTPLTFDGGFTLSLLNDLTLPASRPMVVHDVMYVNSEFDLVLEGGVSDAGTPGFRLEKLGEGSLVLNGSATAGDFIIHEGTLAGTGAVNDLTMSRSVRFTPGESAGLFTVAGNMRAFEDFEYAFDLRMMFELGGVVRGTGYDAVDVGGLTTLDGVLELYFISGFENSVLGTDVFTLISGSALEGEFDNIANGERLFTNDGSGSFLVHYGADSAFGTGDLVLSNFVSAIPEPSSCGLLFAGAALGLARRRRRGRP